MKKRIPNLFVFVMAIVLAFTSACSFSTGPAPAKTPEVTTAPESPAKTVPDLYSGEKETLQIMVWNSVETYETLNEKLLNRFPEMDAKVDFEVVVGGDGDSGVAEKLRLLLASGEKMPDLVRLNYTQFLEFAEADLLYDMSDAIAGYKDDIFDPVMKLMTYKSGIYCLPQEVKPKVWYYRSDIFEQCGINPEEVKTVDAYIQAAKTVYEKTGSYIENYMPPINPYDLYMILSGNGGRLSDDKGNFTVASDPNVKRAFEIIKSYNDSGYFAPISEWSADWQAAFSSQTLVGQLSASWMKQHLIKWVPEQAGKWSCTLWPEEIRSGSDAGMGIWLVFKNCKNPALSADVIAKYSFDPKFRKDVFNFTGIIPPLKSAEADKDYYQHEFFGEQLAKINFEALKYMKVYPYTPTQSMQQSIITQYLNEYVNGNMTIDEALKAAQSDMINQIGNAIQ